MKTYKLHFIETVNLVFVTLLYFDYHKITYFINNNFILSLKMSEQYWEYTQSWNIKSYSNSSSSSENSTQSTTIKSNTQTRVLYQNHSLTVFTNEILSEIIYLTPETYILYSTLHLGIISFDKYYHGKWVLSFYDEPSAINCVDTLKNNGLEVTDIPKLLSKKINLETTIISLIKNPEFSNFVVQVENLINKTKI